jgi:hypothetical protein
LRPLLQAPLAIGKRQGEPTDFVAFHHLGDSSGKLFAPLGRGLDGVGEVGVLIEEDPEVEERKAPARSLASDDIVEKGQRGVRRLAEAGVGEADIVDRADRSRQP